MLLQPAAAAADSADGVGIKGVLLLTNLVLKALHHPKPSAVTLHCLQAWAFMEYLDDALGPLLDFVTSSGLDQSTYLMFTADNGPAVMSDEAPPQRKLVSLT
jgi:hypothetical protein